MTETIDAESVGPQPGCTHKHGRTHQLQQLFGSIKAADCTHAQTRPRTHARTHQFLHRLGVRVGEIDGHGAAQGGAGQDLLRWWEGLVDRAGWMGGWDGPGIYCDGGTDRLDWIGWITYTPILTG